MAALLMNDSKVLFADGVVQLKFRLGDHDRLLSVIIIIVHANAV
jgi:hypothetical protein